MPKRMLPLFTFLLWVATSLALVAEIGPIRPGHRAVESVELFRPDAGRVDWSAQGDRIAFDAKHEDDLYDVFITSPQGGAEQCLTCLAYELRKAHAFNPTWHPSGEWLVIQVRDKPRKIELNVEQMATPHRAFRSELWVVRQDGRDLRQLTKIGEHGGILMDPIFSFEADRLAWSERYSTEGGRWGGWGLRVASISVGAAGIRLGEMDLFEPVSGLVLGQAFAANDKAVFAVTLADDAKAPRLGRIDLETRRWSPQKGAAWGSAPVRLSPREDWLVFSSSRETSSGNGLSARSDLWRVRTGGGSAERLTYFNMSDSDHFVGEALVGDVAWDPNGDRLAVQLVVNQDGLTTERIVLILLNEVM